MTLHTCECCNYSTPVRARYDRHLTTTKHLEAANNKPAVDEDDEDKLTSKEVAETFEMVFEEIDFLKKAVAAKDIALQECKQLIKDMKAHMPTYEPVPQPVPPPPQPIIIQTNQPPPPTAKKETCNPIYHCNALNEDEKLKSIKGVDTYFRIAGDVQFDFSDLQEDVDIHHINKAWVVSKLRSFVSENKDNIPFRYYKGSLYYKNEQGFWEREETPDNKGGKLSNGTYNHSLLVKMFIYIIRNRTITHLDNLLTDRWRLRTADDLFVNMENDTFNRDVWRNSELAGHLQHLLK